MRKRMAALLMISLLAFGLAACSGGASGQNGGNSTSQEQSSTADNEESGADSDASESSESQDDSQTDAQSTGNSNILIAYFSVPEDIDTDGIDADAGASVVVKEDQVMGNLEYMADVIQQTIGGDLFRIETSEEYPLEHETLVDQAAEEQDEEARPELSSQIENLDQYDTILLGYPNWLAYHKLIQCAQIA